MPHRAYPLIILSENNRGPGAYISFENTANVKRTAFAQTVSKTENLVPTEVRREGRPEPRKCCAGDHFPRGISLIRIKFLREAGMYLPVAKYFIFSCAWFYGIQQTPYVHTVEWRSHFGLTRQAQYIPILSLVPSS